MVCQHDKTVAAHVQKREVFELTVPQLAELAELRDRLPSLPDHIAAMNNRERVREATGEEIAALRWMISGSREHPRGVMAVREVFDYHTSADALEVVHVTGTARGQIDLLKRAHEMARSKGQTLIGQIDVQNRAFAAMAVKLGMQVERIGLVWLP